MSKVINATCQEGVVTADGVPVPGTTILSEGVGPSSGALIIDEDRKTYVAKTSPDLKATLEQVIAAFEALITGLESIASNLGTTGSTFTAIAISGSGAASGGSGVGGSGASGAASSIESAKEVLETLKGQLK